MSERLLLVDDEPGLREAVQAYLEESGFTVYVACNAVEGWELLHEFEGEMSNPQRAVANLIARKAH